MTNPILITGASGYVGQAIFAAAVRTGFAVVGAYHFRYPPLSGGAWTPLDLRDAAGVARLIIDLCPAAIIHAAAAWGTSDQAQATIVEGTRAVVGAAAQVGARLIHLSTDVLFDGEHAPYRETDLPAPITFYAAAKTAAEGIVAAHPDHVIVRTSLVTCFDPPDRSTAMVLRALEEAAKEQMSDGENGSESQCARPRTPSQSPAPPLSRHWPVTLFTDEYRSPVRTEDLAAALVELIGHDYRGVLHVAGPERLSRYELGLRIAAYHGYKPSPGIVAGTIANSGLIRPRDCTLDIALARRVLCTLLRPLPVHV